MAPLFITETIENHINELYYLIFKPFNKGFVKLCVLKDQKSFNDNFLMKYEIFKLELIMKLYDIKYI